MSKSQIANLKSSAGPIACPLMARKSRGPTKQVRASILRPEFLPTMGGRTAVKAQDDSAWVQDDCARGSTNSRKPAVGRNEGQEIGKLLFWKIANLKSQISDRKSKGEDRNWKREDRKSKLYKRRSRVVNRQSPDYPIARYRRVQSRRPPHVAHFKGSDE